jgi:hypothetical protein
LLPTPQLNAYTQFYGLNFLCAPSFAIIMFCVARYDTPFGRLMSMPVLVGLGDISYSIYLVHFFTVRLFQQAAVGFNRATAADAVFRVICAIGLTLLVSYASYRLIELPGRAWVRHRLRRGIALAFGERGQHPLERKNYPPGRRFGKSAFAVVATISLALVPVVGEAAKTHYVRDRIHSLLHGNRPEIDVMSASYGLNCKDFHPPAPFQNRASSGNLTAVMKSACDGEAVCDFLVSARRDGDPVNSCGKDLSVEYRCGVRPEVLTLYITGEADGKRALLQCRAGSGQDSQ